jgi:hypothetical protein
MKPFVKPVLLLSPVFHPENATEKIVHEEQWQYLHMLVCSGFPIYSISGFPTVCQLVLRNAVRCDIPRNMW